MLDSKQEQFPLRVFLVLILALATAGCEDLARQQLEMKDTYYNEYLAYKVENGQRLSVPDTVMWVGDHEGLCPPFADEESLNVGMTYRPFRNLLDHDFPSPKWTSEEEFDATSKDMLACDITHLIALDALDLLPPKLETCVDDLGTVLRSRNKGDKNAKENAHELLQTMYACGEPFAEDENHLSWNQIEQKLVEWDEIKASSEFAGPPTTPDDGKYVILKAAWLGMNSLEDTSRNQLEDIENTTPNPRRPTSLQLPPPRVFDGSPIDEELHTFRLFARNNDTLLLHSRPQKKSDVIGRIEVSKGAEIDWADSKLAVSTPEAWVATRSMSAKWYNDESDQPETVEIAKGDKVYVYKYAGEGSSYVGFDGSLYLTNLGDGFEKAKEAPAASQSWWVSISNGRKTGWLEVDSDKIAHKSTLLDGYDGHGTNTEGRDYDGFGARSEQAEKSDRSGKNELKPIPEEPAAEERDGKVERMAQMIPGKPAVTGSLDKESIDRVILKHRHELSYCYEKAMQKNPDISGRVTVKFTVSPTGDVVSALVSDSSLNNRAVESCVTSKIRRWVFSKPDGGGMVVVNYPFDFSPSK